MRTLKSQIFEFDETELAEILEYYLRNVKDIRLPEGMKPVITAANPFQGSGWKVCKLELEYTERCEEKRREKPENSAEKPVERKRW